MRETAMSRYSEPMHPVLRNMLILLSSGLVASVLCAKVYGATLPLDEPAQAATVATVSTTDAAANLRAMLAAQRPIAVEPTADDKPRR
jgi:hypothetical protein